jgi:CRISPR-associated Csx2 family protein
MAKILISLLGTGRYAKGDSSKNIYETTDYLLENKLYKGLTFTSTAIIKHFDIDKVFFIGTNQSMWDNMAEFFEADEECIYNILDKKESWQLKEDDLQSLNLAMDKKLNSIGSKCIVVKDGENEDELWSVFEKFLDILETIDDNDEVYFDITHLFRSVSVMSLVMAEFGKTYKNYQISGLFYGMLRRNEPSLIINVAMFFELLEWAKAIEEIEKFASFDRFVKLSQDKINKNGYNKLANLEDAFSIANMTAIYKSIEQLKTHLNYFSENENKIIRLIAPRFEKFIDRFSKNSLSDFQFELAEFFGEKNNYALAYIALAEAIVTYICEKENLDENNKEARDKAKNIIKEGFDKSYPYSHPKKKFANLFFNQINKIRNNIAHQLETTKNPKDDINNFDKYFTDSRSYLKELF